MSELDELQTEIKRLKRKLALVQEIVSKYACLKLTHPHLAGWIDQIGAIIGQRENED